EDVHDRIAHDRGGPVEHLPAFHLHVVQALIEDVSGWRNSAAAPAPLNEVGPAPLGTHGILADALVRTAPGQQYRAGTVAQEGKNLDVVGIGDARKAIGPKHQTQVTGARDYVGGPGDQRVHETR